MAEWKTLKISSGVGAWKESECEAGTGWKALSFEGELPGYTYHKINPINHTAAGAQTNYQLKITVGESSGAAGADVHCENHCLDFPNDIRFTKEDGETKHDYWIEKIEGTTPNRKATVWIEVASIPASGSVDFYMYYRKSGDIGESSGDNSFEFFDDFDGDLSKWGTAGTPSISGGKVTIKQNDKIRSLNQYGANIITRIDFQRQSASESYGRIGMSNSILSVAFSADDAAYRLTYDSYEDFDSENESSNTNSPNDGTYDTKKTFEIKRTKSDSSYLTGWSKSGSNPLKDIGSSGWFVAVYNEYDDKFYLYIQTGSGAGNQFQCFSFLKADAETPANWTDHGNVYTGSELWEDNWIEPHSIIWETQAMADARRDIEDPAGAPHSGSERKWRIYYCAKPDAGVSQYQTGIALISETNMTNLSAFSDNPVYPGTGDSIADQKAVIYNGEVWMLVGDYNGSCNYAFFTHSSNGIDNWTDCSTQHNCRWLTGTPHVLNGGITIMRDNCPTTPNQIRTGFTTDGETIDEYSGNPVLTGDTGQWDEKAGWKSVAETKDGSCLIDGYYYLFYGGSDTGGTYRMGLAKTQTITEESIPSVIFTLEGDSESPWTPGSNIPDEDMNIRIEQGVTTTDLYVYLALIRKYASPEPTWGSWGSEQS